MITAHTLQVLPGKLAQVLKQHEAALFWGSVEPDFTREDDHRLALQDSPPSHVIQNTWRDAINDTADVWQSIFFRALGPQKALELYGIPAPKGQSGAGQSCR